METPSAEHKTDGDHELLERRLLGLRHLASAQTHTINPLLAAASVLLSQMRQGFARGLSGGAAVSAGRDAKPAYDIISRDVASTISLPLDDRPVGQLEPMRLDALIPVLRSSLQCSARLVRGAQSMSCSASLSGKLARLSADIVAVTGENDDLGRTLDRIIANEKARAPGGAGEGAGNGGNRGSGNFGGSGGGGNFGGNSGGSFPSPRRNIWEKLAEACGAILRQAAEIAARVADVIQHNVATAWESFWSGAGKEFVGECVKILIVVIGGDPSILGGSA
jgi:hypothetical protein